MSVSWRAICRSQSVLFPSVWARILRNSEKYCGNVQNFCRTVKFHATFFFKTFFQKIHNVYHVLTVLNVLHFITVIWPLMFEFECTFFSHFSFDYF